MTTAPPSHDALLEPGSGPPTGLANLSDARALAFSASPNPYLLVTPDLMIVDVNQAYLDVTHTRRDIIGHPLFETFDSGPGETAPDNVRQVRASLEKVIATGRADHLALVHFAIVGPQGAFQERFWSATHTPILDADGKVVLILQHTTDITDLERLAPQQETAAPSALDAIAGGALIDRAEHVQADNRRLENERNRLSDMLMTAPGFMAIVGGPDHVFQMHNDAYAQLIGHRDIAGKTVREALPEIAGQGYISLLDSVFLTGEPHEGRASRFHIQRSPEAPPEEVFLDFVYQPIRDTDRRVIGIFVQGHDVTDRVVSGQRQKLMIDELNHRVKNTLATVQSIAMQTARSHQDPISFAEAFQARLLSLSHTHDLLTRSHWEGADLADILVHETAAHGPNRVLMNGPRVALEPAAALSLGMIFHELATNAAKYGALSAGDGRITVDWSVADLTQPRLHIEWTEQGGPPTQEPQRRGFGSRLIERNIRHDLAGEIETRYAEQGFYAKITIPLDRNDTA